MKEASLIAEMCQLMCFATAWLWAAAIDIPLCFSRNIKNLNLEICIIFARPPCQVGFLSLSFYYLNEIPCINNVTRYLTLPL